MPGAVGAQPRGAGAPVLCAGTAAELASALKPRFGRVSVVDAIRVGGGCISTTLQVRLQGGPPVFLKLAPPEPPGGALLKAEADSLAVLGKAGEVRVPEVLAAGTGWLALEWLEPGPPGPQAWERLGAGLARLHRQGSKASGFGWPTDNFIGSLPQANGPPPDWACFWRARRLEPQLVRARDAGLLRRSEALAFTPLLDRLPTLRAAGGFEGPALLHGDLWGGNVHLLADGEPAIIDPACYHGHREVDLAMAALFGGFGRGFYQAYDHEWPLERAGLEERRAAYQLYYLLVHVNLFGRGYLPGTMDALARALG
ncbi:MAG: fructosamine kinase family protein [Gemmatimonadetes bacterium]|nr:fructosamine kinase family protein [Gemmatimonadota bacterium]